MKRHRVILLVVLLLLVVLFVIFGVPLVRDMLTPPIVGLPTTGAGDSLRDRYTQTALAKTTLTSASETPSAGTK